MSSVELKWAKRDRDGYVYLVDDQQDCRGWARQRADGAYTWYVDGEKGVSATLADAKSEVKRRASA